MGLELVFSAQDRSYSFPLTSVDSDILTVLANRYPKEAETLLAVEGFGEAKVVAKSQVRQSVDRLIQAIEKDTDALPFSYGLRLFGDIEDESYGGTVGGIRFPNDPAFYHIKAGVGKLDLVKYIVDENGKGRAVETIDIREEDSFQSENMGEIKILRKRKPTKLVQNLRELRTFLDETPSDNIEILLG